MNEEKIVISKKLFEEMTKRLEWLDCLESAGVDNWDGIEEAYEMLEETK